MNSEFTDPNQASQTNVEACPYRHVYHMMPQHGWMNDPNGFIYDNGEYHLFYQYYPYAPQWGLMHWGHCVSNDLLHWRHLPIALTPDRPYDQNGCFSGSSIVHNDQLYVFYTGNAMDGRQTQCLAISSDFIHFQKHEKNPIISQPPATSKPNHFRDPYVFQYQDRFYMTVGSSSDSSEQAQGQVLLYTSQNLINWAFVSILAEGGSSMGHMWECPSIFSLRDRDILMLSPEGEIDDAVILGNHNSGYFVGDLALSAGKYMHGKFRLLDHGFDFYAPQTVLDETGQRVMVAWMNTWDTTMPVSPCSWAGSMTLPRVLCFENGVIKSRPIPALEKHKRSVFSADNIHTSMLPSLRGNVCELALQVEMSHTEPFSILLFCDANQQEYTSLTWEPKQQKLCLDRSHSGNGAHGSRTLALESPTSMLTLRIFLDRSSIEVFINDGTYVLSARVFPESTSDHIMFTGDVLLQQIALWNIM